VIAIAIALSPCCLFGSARTGSQWFICGGCYNLLTSTERWCLSRGTRIAAPQENCPKGCYELTLGDPNHPHTCTGRAVSGKQAPLDDVAAVVVVVIGGGGIGIVVVVVRPKSESKSAVKEPIPMESMAQTTIAVTGIGSTVGKPTTPNSCYAHSGTTDNGRAHEAVAKAPAMNRCVAASLPIIAASTMTGKPQGRGCRGKCCCQTRTPYRWIFDDCLLPYFLLAASSRCRGSKTFDP
jgi:hypothetical protein